MRNQEKTVIAILGMHRSGTSLVGQMIHALGVPMGNNLIVANEYNERGYFEDSEVVRIHDDLLIALGRPWQSIGSTLPLPPDWMSRPETELARDKLRIHVAAQLRHDSWAVKDPRMARFLPLWKALAVELGFHLIPLLCVRSPRAVAQSLAARDHFPIGMGELLWTIYNFDILDTMGSTLECVICYEDWFKDPVNNLNRLASAVKVEINDEQCRKLASKVVDPELMHHASSDEEGRVGPHVELYRQLQLWAKTNTPPQKMAELLTIIREGRNLFSPWQEAREDSYLAKAEEARITEHARTIACAEEYLQAYQETEHARLAALEALKRVEQERDAVAGQAEDYLKAYQETEHARLAALEALKRVEHERDVVAGQAGEYLQAYQESERKRVNAFCYRVFRMVTFKWLKK